MAVAHHMVGRALYLTFTRRRVTARRTAFMALALKAYYLLFALVRIGQFIDNILFRGYRTQAIRSPVFIIAPPRSGTTFLQHLMCLDDTQFTYFKTYQTLLPAVSLYRLAGVVAFLDRHGLRVIRPFARWVEKNVFSRWRDIHPISLDGAEEDEMIFLYTMQTPAFYMLFPFVREFPGVQSMDQLPPARRRRVMGSYRRAVQRHLYATGGDRMFLSKNVLSTGRIDALLEAFPDAKLVFIVRSPYQAVPSLLGLFYAAWEFHSPDIPRNSPETHALAQMAFDYYRRLADTYKRLPRDQVVAVNFEDLVQRPEETVLGIFDHFHLEASDRFRQRLHEATQDTSSARSSHHYSLEEYGLSREDVHRELVGFFHTFRLAEA